jgi:hypothetical protein
MEFLSAPRKPALEQLGQSWVFSNTEKQESKSPMFFGVYERKEAKKEDCFSKKGGCDAS